jgi:hypothetical protein
MWPPPGVDLPPDLIVDDVDDRLGERCGASQVGIDVLGLLPFGKRVETDLE